MYFLKFNGGVIILFLLVSFSALTAGGSGPEEDDETNPRRVSAFASFPLDVRQLAEQSRQRFDQLRDAQVRTDRKILEDLQNKIRELVEQNTIFRRILAESGEVARVEQDRLNARLESLREVNESNYAAATAAERKAVEAESSLNAMRAEKEAKEAEIVAAQSALAEARQQITDLIEEQGELAEAKQDLTLRVAALERQLRESQDARESASARESALRRELEESHKTVAELRDSLVKGQEAFIDCRESLALLRAEKERQESAHREELARLTSVIEQVRREKETAEAAFLAQIADLRASEERARLVTTQELDTLRALVERWGEEDRIRLDECLRGLAEEREARRKAELEYRELQQKYLNALISGRPQF